MDYYSMTTILGILFWVAVALTAIGFLAYVYVQIIYMRWNAEDRALERLARKHEEEENGIFQNEVIKLEFDDDEIIDNQEELPLDMVEEEC